MDFFKLRLEKKLDHHSYVEFHSDSDGDGFKAQKPIIDPLIGPNWPQQMNFSKFRLEQELDRHFNVEFRGDSDGNGFKAHKSIIGLLIGPNRP